MIALAQRCLTLSQMCESSLGTTLSHLQKKLFPFQITNVEQEYISVTGSLQQH